nr:MAG TPA: hypothetical protein [Caudoviricetes sp.]
MFCRLRAVFFFFSNSAHAYRKGGLRLHFVTFEGNSSPYLSECRS